MKVVREIVKLIMTLVGWSIPILVSYLYDNTRYLWLFILSIFLTQGVFNHYEMISDFENSYKKTQEDEEVSDER